jgi:hypothetical protein
MTERYTFDPPPDITLKDFADLFRTFLVEVDGKLYREAPANVKRMFKPSISGPSPSKVLN